MKRLLTSTTAISLILTSVGPNLAFAQQVDGNGSVIAADGSILCDATGGQVCDPSLYVEQAAAIEQQMQAAEQQRLADEAAAAEQQRLVDEAAAAEQQRLVDEAAAIEQQRLADEAAAVEQQRLADEANAEAERLRLEEEAKAALDEQQRQQDEANAAAQKQQEDEAMAQAIANVPANMILTGDGSLLAQDNSLLCDVVVSGACDPAQYVEQADAISAQLQADRDAAAAANANVNPDAPQAETMSSAETDSLDIDGLRAVLGNEKALLADMEAQGNTDAAQQSRLNIAFLEQEILARENATIQTGSAEDFPGRSEALTYLERYRAALDDVNAEIAKEKVNNPGNVERLQAYKADIEVEIAEINDYLATRGAGPAPSSDVPPMPQGTPSVAETTTAATAGDDALLARIEEQLVIATEAQDQAQIDALQERKAILLARQAAPAPTSTDPGTVVDYSDDPRTVEELRKEYDSVNNARNVAVITGQGEEEVKRQEDRLADLLARINAKESAAQKADPTAQTDGSGQPPQENLPPNLIRTGDGSLLAEDNTILCDVDVMTVCNADDYVAKANEVTAFLDSQTDKGMDAEITLPSAPVVDPSAGLATTQPVDLSTVTPVEPVKPQATEVGALTDILVQTSRGDVQSPTAAAALPLAGTTAGADGALALIDPLLPLSEVPSSKDAKVVIETLSDANVRNSSQEFAAAPVTLSDGRRSGLTDFEKVGLLALGALVVGAIINEGQKEERRVVSNTGDRVIVLKPDGTYQVYKDDDTILRRPGSTVRTETFNDGSTRTIVQRVDGSQIVTIRDASGRVLRRAQYDKLGRELVLIDDFQPEEPVIIRDLPRPKKDRVVISTKDEDAALKARMAALEAKKAKRGFSLRQIREIPEVRDLAAQIDVESITFDSGSAAIKAEEAENLADLGQLMQELLEANPGELFLIEGHTDAVGHPALNLALSDRRAESVALALAEYFDIPPENLIVQGYGESELLIDSQKDERANRRVLVRVITPLLNRTGG